MDTHGNLLGTKVGVLELFKKISEIGAEIDKQLVKTKTVSTGKFSYDYLPLDDIEEILWPLLKKYNLTLDYPQDGYSQGARIIDLETGAYKESWVSITLDKNAQEVGKQLTYFARYALLMGVLGRRASKDDDAAPKDYQITTRTRRKYGD
jgi:hypothetical protein